jgi:hypothetical protein
MSGHTPMQDEINNEINNEILFSALQQDVSQVTPLKVQACT